MCCPEGLSGLAPSQPLSRGVLLSLEHPEFLSGEVCPAWHPWLFSSGIFPSLASLTPLLRDFVQSCTSSPSQGGPCPAWHCLALPDWGLPCLAPLAPLRRGLWVSSRVPVPLLGSWISGWARLEPNLPRPCWAAVPAPPAAPPGGREQQHPQLEGRQRPLVGGSARIYCAGAGARRSRGGAARWRRAVSAVPALPGPPRTPLGSPSPGSSSPAPVPLARRLRLARSQQGVCVRPGYPVKPSTDTRCEVGPGVPFTGWTVALPIPLAPGHGTRWPLRAHLNSLPRTQECDRGAPSEPPECPDPPAPW